MSVNSTIDQSYLAEVEALKGLLDGFISERNGAQTLEDKSLVEAKAIVLLEQLLDLDYKIQNIKLGDYPEYESYDDFYRNYLYVMQVSLAKLRKLTELFVQHFNSQQYALTDLIGKLKRIRQKRAALALWNNEDAKFVLSEQFLNLDNLDIKFTGVDKCYVDTTQGILTLPVRERSSIPIKTLRIGTGSNGRPGNSDEAVTTNNISPDYAINGNTNNWFEYERLDSGPLELSLIVELAKIEIINNLTLTPVNMGQAYSYVVDDIVFSANGLTQSVRDLTGDIGSDRMTVKSAGNDTEWSLTFLPVQAKTITLKLKQTFSHSVKVASTNGRATNRRRFAIGVQKVGVNRLRYSGVGGINSVERLIRSGLYLTIPVVDVWPPSPELFDALIEISFDGGETWKPAENVDDGVGQSVLMDGTETAMLWRIAVSRDDPALDNATSFLPVKSKVREIDSFMKPVNQLKSPATFSLPQKPSRGDVFVMQPRIARRGNRLRRLLLGVGTGTSSRLEFPFSVIANGLDPSQMSVYVSRVRYTYQEDDAAVGAGEWGFSDDFKELIFSSDLSEGARVTAVLEEERMLFEEKSDGYYHRMEFLFDPDKDNIDITYHPRNGSRVTRLLPRDKKIIPLGVTNIEDESFVLTSSKGITYVSVSDRATLLVTPYGYLLDAVNGTLWLNEAFENDTVRASFPHQNTQDMPKASYDILYEESSVRPWGIRVAPGVFQAQQAQDTVGEPIGKRIDPTSGVFERRFHRIGTASDALTLKYDYVIKGTVTVSSDMFDAAGTPEEVNFIDGKTEFLGLIPMETEITAATEENGSGVVQFRLAAGSLWYDGFEVLFSDTSVFQNAKSNLIDVVGVGDYYVAGTGTVTVYVGTGMSLPGGIGISYYYQDPDFEPQNKYSVDYRQGVFYGGSDLQAGATVKYKASSHKVAYNIGREIDRYSYDRSANAVQVRTEGLDPINRLIKVIWAKQINESSLRVVRDYFSPIFSTLAFRYT